MKKSILSLTLCVVVGISAQAQTNEQIAATFFAATPVKAGEAPGDLFVRSALFFLGTPYVAATLEVNAKEQLVVNLKELDCTTFVETCMALSRAVSSGTSDFENFKQQLKQIRYRKGVIDGYTSRLHYITDWIYDNQRKGIVEDMGKTLGGEHLPVTFSFMSAHANKYPMLKNHPERIAQIKKIENDINRRNVASYIPEQKIGDVQKQIKSGDVICFTTSVEGIDVAHVGFAYWQGTRLTFIHASSAAKKVIIDLGSIVEYCLKSKAITGIMVVRGK